MVHLGVALMNTNLLDMYPVMPAFNKLNNDQLEYFKDHVLSIYYVKNMLSEYSRHFIHEMTKETMRCQNSPLIPSEQKIRQSLEDIIGELIFDDFNNDDDVVFLAGFELDGVFFLRDVKEIIEDISVIEDWWISSAVKNGSAFLGVKDDAHILSMHIDKEGCVTGSLASMLNPDDPGETMISVGDHIWTPDEYAVNAIIMDAVKATKWGDHVVSIKQTYAPLHDLGSCKPEYQWLQEISVNNRLDYVDVVRKESLFSNAFDVLHESGILSDEDHNALGEFFAHAVRLSEVHAKSVSEEWRARNDGEIHTIAPHSFNILDENNADQRPAESFGLF